MRVIARHDDRKRKRLHTDDILEGDDSSNGSLIGSNEGEIPSPNPTFPIPEQPSEPERLSNRADNSIPCASCAKRAEETQTFPVTPTDPVQETTGDRPPEAPLGHSPVTLVSAPYSTGMMTAILRHLFHDCNTTSRQVADALQSTYPGITAQGVRNTWRVCGLRTWQQRVKSRAEAKGNEDLFVQTANIRLKSVQVTHEHEGEGSRTPLCHDKPDKVSVLGRSLHTSSIAPDTSPSLADECNDFTEPAIGRTRQEAQMEAPSPDTTVSVSKQFSSQVDNQHNMRIVYKVRGRDTNVSG